jgi:hypothetical protein
MAQELKTYYRSRTQDVLFAMLGNSGASPAVSSFRRKLRLLVTEGLMITARDIGLLYRLPYLYAEDQALDLVVSQTQSAASGELSAKKQVCLQPLTKYLRSRRANEVMQYWWKGIDDDQAYTLAVKKDNPLISLMDDLWKDGNLDLSFHGVVATVKGYHNNFYFTRILEPRLSPCLVN